jgi:hypothetical protein
MKNPILESLNRIKLMMKYDSSKTLSENRSFLNEETYDEIYDKLKDARIHAQGTDESELEKAIRMIQRTVKSWPEFEALDSFLMKKTKGYGTQRNLQQILNNEMDGTQRDLKTVVTIANLMNSIPGVFMTYTTSTDSDGAKRFKTNSIIIKQRAAGNKGTATNKAVLNWGKNESHRLCLKHILDNKVVTRYKDEIFPTIASKGCIPVKGDTVKNDYYFCKGLTGGVRKTGTQTWAPMTFKCSSGNNGIEYTYTVKGESKTYSLTSNVKPQSSEDGGTKTGGETGGDKAGSTKQGTGYNWQTPPALTDVQSGKGTINRGMSGDSVTTIQNALIKNGQQIKADGKFGGRTRDAVKAFQKQNNLSRKDGVVDSETYNKLISNDLEYRDVKGSKFSDSEPPQDVSQLVEPKKDESTPETKPTGKFA